MADFTGTGVSPIDGGSTVKAPVHVPATQMHSGAPLAGAFAGFENLAKLGMNYMANEQKKDDLKTVTEFTNLQLSLADAVDQGVMSSSQARTRMRANAMKYIAAHPTLSDDLMQAQNRIVSTAGLGKTVAEGTPEEKMREEQTKAALSKGFIDPNRLNEEAYVKEAMRNYLQFERSGEDLKRNTEILSNARAQVGLQKDQVEYKNAVISGKTAQLNLELKSAEVNSSRALAGMASAYTNKFSQDLAGLQQQVISGRMKPEEAVQAANNIFGVVNATASQVGFYAGGDKVSSLTKPMDSLRQNFVDVVTGKISKETYENAVQTQLAKSKLAVIADPKNAQAVAVSNLFGNADSVTKVVQSQLALDIFTKNSTPGGRNADILPKDQSEAKGVGAYLDVLKGNMKQATGADAKNFTVEQRKELDLHLNNVLASVPAYSAGVTNPSEYNQVVDMLASSEFGKYVTKNGGIPVETASKAREVIRQQYEQAVLPLVKQKFDEAGIAIEPMGGYAGQDNATAPVKNSVEVKFQGSGIVFVPVYGKDGVFPKDANNKAAQLNKEVGPIVNRLVRMSAHMEGNTDYKAQWENNYKSVFAHEPTKEAGKTDSPFDRLKEGVVSSNGNKDVVDQVKEVLNNFDFRKDPMADLGRKGLNDSQIGYEFRPGVNGSYSPSQDRLRFASGEESTVVHELRHRAFEKFRDKIGDVISENKMGITTEETLNRLYDALSNNDYEEAVAWAKGVGFEKDFNKYINPNSPQSKIEGVLTMQAVADALLVSSGGQRSYNNYPQNVLKLAKKITGIDLKNNGE